MTVTGETSHVTTATGAARLPLTCRVSETAAASVVEGPTEGVIPVMRLGHLGEEGVAAATTRPRSGSESERMTEGDMTSGIGVLGPWLARWVVALLFDQRRLTRLSVLSGRSCDGRT